LELYATAFASVDALDKLEAFASINGARFYGLPVNTRKVRLNALAQTVPAAFAYLQADQLVPLNAGETLAWTFEG
jgi:dihydroorotase